MGITKRPSGEAAAKAQAGQIIGKGERAKEDRARGEREQARAQQMAAQQQARQMAQEWDVQKMLLNSQQDQAHEMRMRQADLDGEARAKEWEVEKMELHSKFDFEQDEKERLRNTAMYDAAKNTLDERKESLPDGEYEKALFKLDSLYAPKGVTKAVTGLGWQEEKQSPNIKRRKELEAIVSPEFGRTMSLQELEEEVGIDDLSPEDLTELGLDPDDFPDAGKEMKYEIGQTVPTPQGDMTIVGFDNDGEPLVEPVAKKRNEYGGYGATGSW